jgi:hypothetical protein
MLTAFQNRPYSRRSTYQFLPLDQKSLVLYRECGGAVVSGIKVLLIAGAFPIQH